MTLDVRSATWRGYHLVVMALIVMTVLLYGPPIAFGHTGPSFSYSCSETIEAPHQIFSGKHQGYAQPLGVNPPVACQYYRGQVTTTSWSGGGGSGWYTHATSTSTSLWQTLWWNSVASNCTYKYIVRTAAQGQAGSTTYGWRYNTHGGGITCP